MPKVKSYTVPYRVVWRRDGIIQVDACSPADAKAIAESRLKEICRRPVAADEMELDVLEPEPGASS